MLKLSFQAGSWKKQAITCLRELIACTDGFLSHRFLVALMTTCLQEFKKNPGEFLGKRKGFKHLRTHPCLRRRSEGNHGKIEKLIPNSTQGCFLSFWLLKIQFTSLSCSNRFCGPCQLKTRMKRETALKKIETGVSLLCSSCCFGNGGFWKQFRVLLLPFYFPPPERFV